MNKDNPECVYVVSDIHLGANGACPEEFTAFTRWLKTIPDPGICPDTPFTFRKGDQRKSERTCFRRPSKLILLGDILDLWDPRRQDRVQIVKDAVGPLACMHDFPGEIIYVSGNHDMDIDEIRETLDGRFSWSCTSGNSPNFELSRDHYPATEKRRLPGIDAEETVLPGIIIGDVKYSFIHGHQLDPEQIQYHIGEITKSRFDPVDAVTDLANVTFIKEMNQTKLWAIAACWVTSILLLFWLQEPVLKAGFTTILVLAAMVQLDRYRENATKVIRERKFAGWEKMVLQVLFIYGAWTIMAIILVLLILFTDLYSGVMSGPVFWIIFILLTFLFISCPVVRFIAGFMRGLYENMKRRGRSSKETVDEGFVRDRDTFDCDVVVFGHTHKEDSTVLSGSERSLSRKGKPLLFINTGCWVAENGETCTGRRHPFVFINEQGVAILKWKNGIIEDCPV
ncbi:MAG: Calcineurin-like phosphoesterase superfamily domain protein [Methanoregula sp. PtaU1.Bin051]|nr:MAG: Calcineurin-like phosphoesterase superfamily domain protein [Methanoregula sp. PtaU1.Bin051]